MDSYDPIVLADGRRVPCLGVRHNRFVMWLVPLTMVPQIFVKLFLSYSVKRIVSLGLLLSEPLRRQLPPTRWHLCRI